MTNIIYCEMGLTIVMMSIMIVCNNNFKMKNSGSFQSILIGRIIYQSQSLDLFDFKSRINVSMNLLSVTPYL